VYREFKDVAQFLDELKPMLEKRGEGAASGGGSVSGGGRAKTVARPEGGQG
jgi:hypothetical protein